MTTNTLCDQNEDSAGQHRKSQDGARTNTTTTKQQPTYANETKTAKEKTQWCEDQNNNHTTHCNQNNNGTRNYNTMQGPKQKQGIKDNDNQPLRQKQKQQQKQQDGAYKQNYVWNFFGMVFSLHNIGSAETLRQPCRAFLKTRQIVGVGGCLFVRILRVRQWLEQD